MTDKTLTLPPIVFADCETTSLDARRRLAWDVALIRRDHNPDGFTEQTYQFYVEVDLADADPFALRIGHFWERHPLGRMLSGATDRLPDAIHGLTPGGYFAVAGANTMGAYLTQAAASLAIARITHGAHVVGAIPSFDTDTFQRGLFENGLTPSWHYHIIDIEALAVGFLKGRQSEREDQAGHHGPYAPDVVIPMPWRSDDLTAMLDVEPCPEEDRHTALGDAEWAKRMYDAVMGVAR